MITLLLIHSLAARAQSVPTVNEETTSSSCRDIDNCRTRWNIIWSCLTTIFLCTWVAIHPNIPEPVDTKGMNILRRWIRKATCIFQDKLPLFLCAVLLPEYILAFSLRQRLMVRKIINDNADLQLTTAHGFFIIMGGFHYFGPYVNAGSTHEMTDIQLEAPLLDTTSNSDPIEGEVRPVHPLTHQDVTSMVRKKLLILPTENEIQDRGKSDWLAKTIILTQTLWFVVQCIARGIEHLPTTELEVVTLAYVAINIGISIAWWDKPRNVDCPIRVFKGPLESDTGEQEGWFEGMFSFIIGGQDDSVNLHQRRKVPIFYSGKPQDSASILSNIPILSDLIAIAISVIFGAVHCIAWSFEFPSSTQTTLWRLSSVAITSIPFIVLSIFTIVLPLDHLKGLTSTLFTLFLFLILVASAILYVICRFITLVIAFMNLSSLPPGVLQAVYWTTFIPHV